MNNFMFSAYVLNTRIIIYLNKNYIVLCTRDPVILPQSQCILNQGHNFRNSILNSLGNCQIDLYSTK